MAAGQPFLTLPPVLPLDLTMEDGTSILHAERHDLSKTNLSSSTTTESYLTTQNNKDLKTETSKQPLMPAPSLRKSVSVDSFAHYGRESPVLSGPRQNRGNTSSALEPPRGVVYSVSSSLKKEREEEFQANRHRRPSNGSSKHGEPSLQEADLERSDSLGTRLGRYRPHSLFKPQDHAKPLLQALPHPARTPTTSTASSLNTIVSDITSSSSRPGDIRSLSSSSLQQLPRRGTVPTIVPTGRARSGSLGMYSSTPLRRPTGGGIIFDSRNVDPTVTVVVAGSPGCGKSTVIRKGLKKFALSEPIACRTISGIPGLSSVINYIRRTGRVGQLENVIDCPLKVLEANALSPINQGSSPIRNNPILDSVSRVDGVVLCYDASNASSFAPLEKMLFDYSAMRIPVLVLACKSDLVHRVDSTQAHNLCKQFDIGVIEVNHEAEKDRIGLAFEFLLQAVWRDRRDRRHGSDVKYRNPASPKLLKHSVLWHTSNSITPIASSAVITEDAASNDHDPTTIGALVPQHPTYSTSPSASVSLNDPRNLRETHSNWKRGQPLAVSKSHSTFKAEPSIGNIAAAVTGSNYRDTCVEKTETREKDLKPTLYMTLDELLDKLLFLSVSADDPSFIIHFLLTYRRFATPRNVLLAMQKRIRQLDNPSGDPMFACFAQMRICALLESWIKDYPHDFAVRGASGALSALVKSILSKTYLLHYGSELLPFLETLPGLKDDDSAWAIKIYDIGDTSDSESALDDEETIKPLEMGPDTGGVKTAAARERTQPSRERKSSIPLAKALRQVVAGSVNGHGTESAESSMKQKIKDLIKLAHEVMLFDSEAMAHEITRLQANLFLRIQPRHWLHLTFVGKNEFSESITALISFSNHLAEWVLSLILCHEKPRNRARQIEKFVVVANKLRHLNNYSALRAFIAGIHSSTYPGDETTELFKAKSPEHYKNLQSWELLFRPLRSHRSYRMALRNSKGGCIPALEVHIQDLIRAHEGNPDSHIENSSKIHWGKFNLIGKFIISTTHCQIQCRDAEEYIFPDRGDVLERLLRYPLITEELVRMRLPPEWAENEHGALLHTQVPLPKAPPPPVSSYKTPLASALVTTQTVSALSTQAQFSVVRTSPTQTYPQAPHSRPVVPEPVSPKTRLTRPLSTHAPVQDVYLNTKVTENLPRRRGIHSVYQLQYW